MGIHIGDGFFNGVRFDKGIGVEKEQIPPRDPPQRLVVCSAETKIFGVLDQPAPEVVRLDEIGRVIA